MAHGALILLLFPICAYALDLRGPWKTAVWILTGALMAVGMAEGFATALELREVAGLVRYASGDATPGWARVVSGVLSYGAVTPLIIAGIAVWIRQKTPLLFLSGFLMFAFSALGPASGNLGAVQKLFVQNAQDEFVSARRRREACRGTLTDDNAAMADSDKHNV